MYQKFEYDFNRNGRCKLALISDLIWIGIYLLLFFLTNNNIPLEFHIFFIAVALILLIGAFIVGKQDKVKEEDYINTVNHGKKYIGTIVERNGVLRSITDHNHEYLNNGPHIRIYGKPHIRKSSNNNQSWYLIAKYVDDEGKDIFVTSPFLKHTPCKEIIGSQCEIYVCGDKSVIYSAEKKDLIKKKVPLILYVIIIVSIIFILYELWY